MIDLTFSLNIGNLDNLITNINKNCDTHIEVGIPPYEQYDDGRSVAEVALINEYGLLTGSVEHPPRPFMSETLKNNKRKYLQMMESVVPSFLTDIVGASGFIDVGREIEQDIKLSIDNWSPCDPRMNTKGTIKQKNKKNGNGQAVLIDSGKMKESIRWWVAEGKVKPE